MTLTPLTEQQESDYDETLQTIRDELGSYHAISIRIYMNCERTVSSETVRTWFANRTVPVEIVFSLYEILDRTFDPFTLVPWLKRHVKLRPATCD